MTYENFYDLPVTYLASAINSTQTTITIGNNFGYNLIPNFRVQIDQELLLVTAVSGLTFTVVRGVEGTTASSHFIDSAVIVVLTAGGLDNRFSTLINRDSFNKGTPLSIVNYSNLSSNPGRVLLNTAGYLQYDNGSSWDSYRLSYCTNNAQYLFIPGINTYLFGVQSRLLIASTPSSTTLTVKQNTGFRIGDVVSVGSFDNIETNEVSNVVNGTDPTLGPYTTLMMVNTFSTSTVPYPAGTWVYRGGGAIGPSGDIIPDGYATGGLYADLLSHTNDTVTANDYYSLYCIDFVHPTLFNPYILGRFEIFCPYTNERFSGGICLYDSTNMNGILFELEFNTGIYYLNAKRILNDGSIDIVGFSYPIDINTIQWMGLEFDKSLLHVNYYVSYDGINAVNIFTITNPTWVKSTIDKYGVFYNSRPPVTSATFNPSGSIQDGNYHHVHVNPVFVYVGIDRSLN